MAKLYTFSDDVRLVQVAERLRPKVVSRADAEIAKRKAIRKWTSHLVGVGVSAGMWWALIYGGMKLYAWLTRIGLL